MHKIFLIFSIYTFKTTLTQQYTYTFQQIPNTARHTTTCYVHILEVQLSLVSFVINEIYSDDYDENNLRR